MIMEYLLVQVLVTCAVAVFMNAEFYNWATADFGPVGMEIQHFFERLLGGLSLPVP